MRYAPAQHAVWEVIPERDDGRGVAEAASHTPVVNHSVRVIALIRNL
jgi:hypothetical protein